MTDNVYEIESGYIPPINHKFTGEYNNDQERTGRGCQEWAGTHDQTYTGTFLHNNLHGNGRYVELNKAKSYMYEGTFYANDFEGYSNVTYLNGDYFEGLFRCNRRFGPGVYTYADGTQNVGLWYGTQLMRLSCVVLGEWVPKLARSSNAKAKLLKYRKLVPIRQEYDDVAKDILVKLNARPEVIANSDQLYNTSVRNVNSLFFNKKAHDMEFFGKIDCTIDVAVDNVDAYSAPLQNISQEPSSDIAQDILDYLLENVDIVEGFPKHQRQELLYEAILATRQQRRAEIDTVEIKRILDEFMNDLDDLLSKSNDERKLVVNRKTIRRKLPKCEKPTTDYTVRKVAVTDLLAWNNEEMSIEMMLQVFAHRNKEDSVSFSIARLLIGDRLCFNVPGEMEKNCVLFLNLCSAGNNNGFIQIFKENCLNPDICDARGNSGIIFASARDRWKIIKLLCDVGANLDIMNDEGLTALGICILRYIALRNDIKDWERAFVPDALVTREEEMQVKQWHPHVSLTNLNLPNAESARESVGAAGDSNAPTFLGSGIKMETTFRTMTGEDNETASNAQIYEELKNMEIDMIFKAFQEPYLENVDLAQKYILNVKCMQAIAGKSSNKPKVNIVSERDSNVTAGKSLSRRQSKRNEIDANFMKDNKMKVVFTTIKVLLGCGADPNLSRVPLPVLLLAIFSRDLDLFNLILESKADPNIASDDEGVTALHILAALPFTADNLAMFKLLLVMGADPNIRTTTYHWVEEKEKLIGKREPTDSDLGKTALHILSMRYDFLNNDHIQQHMITHLIEHGGRANDVYLGHVPLTLAILRGNLNLIRFYLDSGVVDPYTVLGEKMGVATTILILHRYANVLPIDRCKNVYDVFVEKNVNPLVDFEEYGNAIEFMAAEDAGASAVFPEATKAKGKMKRSHSKYTSSKFKLSSSVSLVKKKQNSEEVKNYLLECTRDMLQRHIQYKAFKYLKRFITQNVDPDDEVLVAMVKFLPVKDLVNLLQLLIRKGVVQSKPTHFYIMLTMLQLSKKHNKSKLKKSRSSEISSLPPPAIVKVVNWLEEDHEPVIYFNMIEPALDAQTDKYKVCFYCCKRTNKDLIVCPRCGLVYFCSEECNKLSNRHSTIHKCNVLFYDDERAKKDRALANGLDYKNKSKLANMLDSLDEQLHQQFGMDFLLMEVSSEGFDFDKLACLIFDKLLQGDPKFTAQVERHLRESNLVGFEKHIQLAKDGKMKSKEGKYYGSEYKIGSELFNHINRKKNKEKGSRDGSEKRGGKGNFGKDQGSKSSKKSSKNSSNKDEGKRGEKKKGEGKRGDGKKGEGQKSVGKSSVKRIKGKTDKRSNRSSDHSYKGKRGKDRSKVSKKSKGRTLETIYRRDKAKVIFSKGDKSSKNAVYKHHIARSDYTRSRKDKYEQEQAKLREKYRDQQGIFGGIWGNMGKFSHGTVFDELGRIYGRLPNKCQFFLEKLSELFPDVDISALFWPYVCYVDGQLYYRFLEEQPLFLETYSNV